MTIGHLGTGRVVSRRSLFSLLFVAPFAAILRKARPAEPLDDYYRLVPVPEGYKIALARFNASVPRPTPPTSRNPDALGPFWDPERRQWWVE